MGNDWMTVFGIAFIFIMTTLGASLVYVFKNISLNANALFMGLASGIMIAASVWSLLLPAIEQAETGWGDFAFFPVALGILCGGIFLIVLDKFVAWLRKEGNKETKRGLSRSARLFIAVTAHNIPEGLAVGFAFGTAMVLGSTTAYLSALGLAIGIGIQNFPEGAAVSLPMRAEGISRYKAFLWGAGSGVAEPIFAGLGYFTAAYIRFLQPWLLAFSAGAMLFVVAEELVPASKTQKAYLGACGLLMGFILMMVLDVALG